MNPKDQAILDELLSVLSLSSQAAIQVGSSIGNKDVQGGAALAALLLSIAQKAVSAIEAHQGAPIDLSLLQRIDPVA